MLNNLSFHKAVEVAIISLPIPAEVVKKVSFFIDGEIVRIHGLTDENKRNLEIQRVKRRLCIIPYKYNMEKEVLTVYIKTGYLSHELIDAQIQWSEWLSLHYPRFNPEIY
ncbi:hypothetical protein [Nostoc sp. 106C]|uniref:hypothetical protein n=1 Tax=Nostoc sp. 106C TaxID=1932667 RepID=UPI000A3AB011|nr:hypothetical protein [Nostoc sp. 106C]OUL31191.1 hypothetical protein BV375_12615 [Nostoc sp. 106C]